MTPFDNPGATLGSLDAQTAGLLLAQAAEITLILDADGRVIDRAINGQQLEGEGCDDWLGRLWIDTVTVESRPKIESLLEDAFAGKPGRQRQVNHPSPRGQDLPVTYSAVKLRGSARGCVIVFGRDMRPAAVLQQRVVNAQQAMERDYWRLRDAETRYRLLFQIGTDAMLIVDGATYRITEANAAANELFGDSVATLVGASFPIGFDRAGMQAAQVLLGTARAGRAASDLRVSLAHGEGEVLLAAAMFRQENTPMFVVRGTRNLAGEASAGAAAMYQLQLRLAQSLPDCLVLTDHEGSILWANPAFAQLAQLATADQARGEPLGRWLGRTGVDQSVLVTNLRQRSAVRLFSTTLRGELGSVAEVEISAAVVNHGTQSALGFAIRDVERRIPTDARGSRELPQSVGHLTELVGRVPIKEIVGETTDVIEQLCIEAALDLTRDNRAAAAELLGLSRQSLYVKMRRFGLGDLAAEAEA